MTFAGGELAALQEYEAKAPVAQAAAYKNAVELQTQAVDSFDQLPAGLSSAKRQAQISAVNATLASARRAFAALGFDSCQAP